MKIKKYSTEKNDAPFAKKALSYAAMTGAFLAAAGQSNAQINYTDVNPNDTVMSPDTTQYDFFPIDFDNDGVADIVIQHQITASGSKYAWVGTFSQTTGFGAPVSLANRHNAAIGSMATTIAHYIYPYVLNAGDPVSAGQQFHSFTEAYLPRYMTLLFRSSSFHVGHWYGVDGFLGVRFETNSLNYYGWVELDVDTMANRVIVKGYAYEESGELIHAGDTVPTGIHHHSASDGSFFMLTNNPSTVKNPASLLFSSEKHQEYRIEIINNLGDIVSTFSGNANAGSNRKELYLEDVAAGNYFIRLTMGDKVQHGRLIVTE